MHTDALSVRVCIQPAPQLKQNNNRTPFCPAKSSRVSVSPLQSSICSSDPNPETQEGICNAVHGHILVEKISLSRRTEDYMFSVNTPFFFFFPTQKSPHTLPRPCSSQQISWRSQPLSFPMNFAVTYTCKMLDSATLIDTSSLFLIKPMVVHWAVCRVKWYLFRSWEIKTQWCIIQSYI